MQQHRVTFDNKKAPFQSYLKQQVDQYFEQAKTKPTGNFKLYFKTIFFFTAAIYLYVHLVFFTPSTAVALLMCAALGIVMAGIGFNVMHDACHGSYSTKQWINDMFGLTCNALGANAFIWKTKHNVIHHTYTNIDGVDDDIAKEPLIRHCDTQKKKGFHKYQHIYVWPLYLITSIYWCLYTDFEKYFKKKVHNTPLRGLNFKEHFIFWFSKVMLFLVYIIIPSYMIGFKETITGYLFMHATLGFVLAIVFQLAHVVEEVHFEEAINKSKKIEYEWAVHQVRTTANFATDNRLITWFVGGLNYQVEHHLFPRVSHVHYPKINSIIKQACEQFGVKYIEYPTMAAAVASHYRVIRDLGK